MTVYERLPFLDKKLKLKYGPLAAGYASIVTGLNNYVTCCVTC
ncbi:hypothetical protein MTsPCn5_32140 [Croceitalea sp. MTPC5]|nr:hypothetical protein MTsPCn5_32140 [Croceitalea sp. MTPC5]